MNVVDCLTAAAALFATSIGHAQSGGPGASQPVFRASVELVQLDVSVTDKHGVVVPGLGASDFLLKQDGAAIPVQLATFVSGRANQTRFVFFVDDYHLAFENFARLREAVERFTAHGVPYGAEMLVMPASFVGERAFTFTTNPVAVTMDVADLSWGKSSRRLSRRGAWGSCDNLTNDLRANIFTNGTMGTLTALLNALQQIDGRKAVIVLTDGLVSGCRDEDDVPEHLRRITDIANRGSSVLYGVDTRPFGASGSNLDDDDLKYLADRTGGIAGRSNAIDAVLSRVAADQRGYYLLAYEPPASTFKKGRLQYRDVKVSVTNPDLQVRSRAGFYGVPDAALARK
jgi:VWFA-related protein